jgi:membrane protein implicated in regulation of membrane protease activity
LNDGIVVTGATTVPCCVSLTEISVRVAIVTVLALVALVAIGWRRPAPRYPRRTQRRGAPQASRRTQQADIDGVDLPTTQSSMGTTRLTGRLGRTSIRKLLDVVGLGSIAAFIGIVVALVISTAIAWLVTALLNRL